jgi:hypothetical protein
MSSAPSAVVSVTPDTPLLPSGQSGEAQLQLSADAPASGSVVQLTSSDPAALSVPSSVTIQLTGQANQFLGAGSRSASSSTRAATSPHRPR